MGKGRLHNDQDFSFGSIHALINIGCILDFVKTYKAYFGTAILLLQLVILHANTSVSLQSADDLSDTPINAFHVTGKTFSFLSFS